MHGVLLTSAFERQAKAAGLDDAEIQEIAVASASDPRGGELMVGTGGARKMRHAGRGEGKSGGYRAIHYCGGDDVPLFLLALIDKGKHASLSQAERNGLAKVLPRIAEAYRAQAKTGEASDMTKLGEELLESADEALAIAQGKAKPARTITVEAIDVAAIRKRLGLSQDAFAKKFGLSAATLRDWEQGRRQMDRTAQAFLKVIDRAPEAVEKALKAA